MRKITKKSIMQELKLNKVWNKITNVFGYKVATVMWHPRTAWKIVDTDNFNDITPWEKSERKNIIKEFYEQKELCDYLYSELNQNC